ncbi:MAG: AraC family transcriptional regulator, partial [Proteobacteria bacterium]|nr:AraC family transcriptional regulator [Pseudomonadota bacterium]
MMGFSALVAKLGGNPERLIASCGLDQRVLDEPDNIIPFSLGARLLHLAAKETNCPHFGLLLGQRQDLALLGPVGFLVCYSPDVRTAILDLIRYMHLHVQGASARLSTEGALAQFSYDIHTRGMLGAEQVYNVCISNEFNFMRMLCGKDWMPSAVNFCYPKPADDAPFVAFFRAPVHFNQQSSTLVFSAEYLDRPTISADPGLRKILQEYITQIEAKYSGDFCAQLRGILKMLLPTGKCSVDRVSELFSMSRRTLHRHLMVHDTTFEVLLDALRYETVNAMIRQPSVPIGHLADMLGYRSVSAFNHAFHRWHGIAPREWRSKNL